MGQGARAKYAFGIMGYASHIRAKGMGRFEGSVDVKRAVETMGAVSFVKTLKVDLSNKNCHV
jgi:hypothetical protein